MMGSDDEEEEERTIKSGATKRAEALDKALDEAKKYVRIADFNQLDSGFGNLEKEIQIASDGDLFEEKGTKLPIKVLKLFLEYEDCINAVTNEQKKKMSKVNSVSFNRIKQKFKKFLQGTGEDNMTYELQLKRYREDPISEPESEEEEKEEEKPKKKPSKEESEEEEEIEEESGEQESEEDSESDEEIRNERKAAK